jgi:hypothetical protein
MREIFRTRFHGDPGRVFYTITQADIGNQLIPTEIGSVYTGNVIGRVQPGDVGKRLYRVPTDGGISGQSASWIWQCESESQRDARLAEAAADANGWPKTGGLKP